MKMSLGKQMRLILSISAIISAVSLTHTPSVAGDPSQWKIGKPIATYWGLEGFSIDEAYAEQMAEGGWNLVWTRSDTVSELNATLNIAQSHGLRALWAPVSGNISDAAVLSIRNHPALYAYFVADEPSASQFSDLASIVSHLRTLDPHHLAYINLLPCYVGSNRFGVSDYQTYVSQFISTVHPDLLSYDHYQFKKDADTPDYFKNLAVISHAAKQAGIPFLNIVQSCTWDDPEMRVPNGNELRYLYHTSLAYGAKGISDFVYYAAPGDMTAGGMVSISDGRTTTELYDAAKTINPAFVAVAQQVQSLTHIGAYHLGDLPPGYGTTDGSSPLRLPSTSPFKASGIVTTTYETNKPVRGAVIGLWGPDDQLADATYAYVVNLNYSSTLSTQITGPGNLSVFDPATGVWTAQAHAWADVTLEKGGGVLVGLTSAIPEP